MNRIHKKIRFSLIGKLYFFMFFFVLFGWYKNALLPYLNGFYPFSHLVLVALYPIGSFFIGGLFDFFFKSPSSFTNKFYGLLFSLLIPISMNVCTYFVFLSLILFANTFLISKKDSDFNFLVFGKLVLVAFLVFFHSYNYSNLLEESNQFVYSYMDGIFGFNVSGMFTSSTLLCFLAFSFLFFDAYYKKEIPLYSYGIYLLTLVVYAFFKSDMRFLLQYMFSSSVLFCLVMLAPLSAFSPYSKKRVAFYSILLGMFILPFSLLFNFYEGVYISLFLANLLIILLNKIQIHLIKCKI